MKRWRTVRRSEVEESREDRTVKVDERKEGITTDDTDTVTVTGHQAKVTIYLQRGPLAGERWPSFHRFTHALIDEAKQITARLVSHYLHGTR